MWMIILFWSNQLKKYLPNFPTPKESWNQKFQTQQILRSSPSLKIQSNSTGVSFHPKSLYRKFCLWRTSQPQKRLSNTKLNRRDLQVKRKQPGMGKEPSILYFLETEIHSTGKRSTLNSGERAWNKLQWGGVLGIKRLSWRRESMVEF